MQICFVSKVTSHVSFLRLLSAIKIPPLLPILPQDEVSIDSPNMDYLATEHGGVVLTDLSKSHCKHTVSNAKYVKI